MAAIIVLALHLAIIAFNLAGCVLMPLGAWRVARLALGAWVSVAAGAPAQPRCRSGSSHAGARLFSDHLAGRTFRYGACAAVDNQKPGSEWSHPVFCGHRFRVLAPGWR